LRGGGAGSNRRDDHQREAKRDFFHLTNGRLSGGQTRPGFDPARHRRQWRPRQCQGLRSRAYLSRLLEKPQERNAAKERDTKKRIDLHCHTMKHLARRFLGEPAAPCTENATICDFTEFAPLMRGIMSFPPSPSLTYPPMTDRL
jgi:hypothetical protein